MADKFDVYNGSEAVAHTEGTADSDGYTPITVSSLAPVTTYDKFSVAHAGGDFSQATAVPSFTTSAIEVTGVTLDKQTLKLKTGDTATLKATVAPSNASDKAVTWSSSSTANATVDASGKVTAVKAGSADITVTTHDGSKTAKATVTITDPTVAVTGVTLDSANASSVEVGSNITLAATIAPSNATDKALVWSSSDKTFATVDSSGKVTGVKPGSADITVKAHGDQTKTAKATIEVTAAEA